MRRDNKLKRKPMKKDTRRELLPLNKREARLVNKLRRQEQLNSILYKMDSLNPLLKPRLNLISLRTLEKLQELKKAKKMKNDHSERAKQVLLFPFKPKDLTS